MAIVEQGRGSLTETGFSARVFKGLKAGVENWAANLNPRDKGLWWLAGANIGAIESVALLFAPLPGGTFIKMGLNLALGQGVYFAANKYYEIAEKRAIGGGLEEKIDSLKKDHQVANERIKNFFLGVSAGATYASVGGLGTEVAKSVMSGGLPNINLQMPKISVPEIKIPGIKMPNLKQADSRKIFPLEKDLNFPNYLVPEADKPGDILAKAALKIYDADTPQGATVENLIKEAAAGSVGEHLSQTNQIVDEALKTYNIDPKHVSAKTYELIRSSIQGELEEQVNTAFVSAAGSGNSLEDTIIQGKTSFAQALEDSHQGLVNKAKGLIDTYQLTGEQAAVAAEVNIDPGMTAGEILENNGYSLSWGMADIDIFSTHIAANLDLLNNNINLSELAKIVEDAKAGDEKALQKLKDILHWLPADKKFKILTAAGVRELSQSFGH